LTNNLLSHLNLVENFQLPTEARFALHFMSALRSNAPEQIQILVQNLPPSTTNEFLHIFFDGMGELIKIDLQRARLDPNFGEPLRRAFLTIQLREQPTETLYSLNFSRLDGIPIQIIPNDWMTKQIIKSGCGNVFFDKMRPEIEESQLPEAFSSYGEVISVNIARKDGVSLGYGYVQFRNENEAVQAVSKLRGAFINGQEVVFEYFGRRVSRKNSAPFTSVYVKGLPQSMRNEEDLVGLFSRFGEITSVFFPLSNGHSRGFGMCNFQTHESAVNAMLMMNGQVVDGSTLEVERGLLKPDRILNKPVRF
jgi:polyadenylate-binding protein